MSTLRKYDDGGLVPRDYFFELVIAKFGLDATVEELVQAYYPSYVGQYRLDHDVRAGLADLRRAGWAVGVVTNGPPPQVDKLRVTGLDRLVDGYAVSGIELVQKPDPEIFRRAAAACGADLSGAVMVGDNPVADIGGAVLSGIGSIWVDLGRSWCEPAYRPHRVCSGPRAAIDLLLRL